MRNILGCIIIFVIMTSQIFAGIVYYVDATNGDDSKSGTSESNAWRTIAKINGQSFSPGDKILFKRGEIWREELIIPSSGTIGNPITFGAYGTGNKPIISGADTTTTWTLVGGTVYYNAGCTDECNQVWYNGARLLENNGATSTVGTNKWGWDSNILYVNVGEDPEAGILEVGQRQCCIKINAKSHLKIENFELKYSNGNWGNGGSGIYINTYTGTASGITVQNCTIHDHNWDGIFIYSTAGNENTDILIQNNTLYECSLNEMASGAIASDFMDNSIIENNICYGNKEHGIRLWHSDGNMIQNNICYKNGSSGITISDNGTGTSKPANNIVRYNECYGNDTIDGAKANIELVHSGGRNKYYYNLAYNSKTYGMRADGATNEDSWYNNVIYNSDAEGIYVWNSSNFTIKNNIVAESGNEHVEIRNGTTGHNINNNLYGDDGSQKFNWDGTKYNFSDWKIESGQDADSPTPSNPLFVNASNEDFSLQSISPSIDAGTGVGLTKDYEGNSVPAGWGVDIGAYEYQDETPGNPVASFTVYPTEGIPPLEVSFDASASYDPNGNISSYEWNFGDGNTGSGITVNHTYQNRGAYTAKLTVTNNDEQSASDSQEIKVGTPPVALFEAFPSSGNAPLKVELDASYSYDTDGEVVSYDWEFGDGTQGNGKKVTHTYYNYGNYTATLKITDNDGLFDATSKEISVAEMPYPPLNVKVTRVTNRGNSLPHCFCRVEWSKNPKNTGKHNIVKYRIYRKIRAAGDNTYVLIHEVGHHTFGYDDRSLEDIKELNLYTYAVSAVDDKNRESELGKPTLTQ